MWKRDEAVRPASGQPAAPQPPAPTMAGAGPRPETSQQMEKDIVNIGKSVVIKGELNGSEDLTIEGHVEGTIQLRDHVLTIGPNGRIKAQVFAKAVIVLGALRLPRARTSAAASTCSERRRRPGSSRGPRPSRPPRRSRPRWASRRCPPGRSASERSARARNGLGLGIRDLGFEV